MRRDNVLFLLGGLFVGAAGGAFGAKLYLDKKYQERYDQQIAEMEEYYGKTDEYKRVLDEETDGVQVNPTGDGQNLNREDGILSDEERSRIKERLKYNYDKTTNYAAQYRKYDSAGTETSDGRSLDPADFEHPLDDDEEAEMIYGSTEEAEMNEDHQANRGRAPKIISADDAAALPGHIENVTLYFYDEDEILCDEETREIDDPEMLIGDALTKYGFNQSDERIIFVMNYSLDTCYEIQKINGAFRDVAE